MRNETVLGLVRYYCAYSSCNTSLMVMLSVTVSAASKTNQKLSNLSFSPSTPIHGILSCFPTPVNEAL